MVRSPEVQRLIVQPEISEYLRDFQGEPDPLLDALERHSRKRAFPLIGRESGTLIQTLCTAIQARRVFEFGSGFGYSAYFFAAAVGAEGEVIGSEKDAHELDDHRMLYNGHSFAERVHIHQGSAFEILDAQAGFFDAVLIDLDKVFYPRALEQAIARVRPGGWIFSDNVLWGGRVARPAAVDDTATRALQTFNQQLMTDPRIRTQILPVGDGLGVSLRLDADGS